MTNQTMYANLALKFTRGMPQNVGIYLYRQNVNFRVKLLEVVASENDLIYLVEGCPTCVENCEDYSQKLNVDYTRTTP